MIRWMDNNFKKHRTKYILQSLMAFSVIFIMTLFIDIVVETTVMASLGATVFIVFTMPHTTRSKVRYIVGGYTIGFIVGFLCPKLLMTDSVYINSFEVALAVGIAIFLMVITNTEHPPAAAAAMGVAVDGIDLQTAVAFFICILFVLGVKFVMRKWLINLI